MPSLIRDVHIRFTQEELDDLGRMAAAQQVPVVAVIRACVRHFLLEWRDGKRVVADLGSVVWEAREVMEGNGK